MKKVLAASGVALALALGACAPATDDPSFGQISSEVAAGEAVLIDVRTAAEYDSGHIDGAQLHELGWLAAGSYPDVAKDEPVYVYCQSGNRSAQATKLLVDAGFTDVTDLGGIGGVEGMGGEVVS